MDTTKIKTCNVSKTVEKFITGHCRGIYGDDCDVVGIFSVGLNLFIILERRKYGKEEVL